MAHHRCDISLKKAVLTGRNDPEIEPANSLHASAYYSDYNERFGLKIPDFLLAKTWLCIWVKLQITIDVYFPEENNTGLPPVPYHQHSPLHILKVTDISLKLDGMQCETKRLIVILCNEKNTVDCNIQYLSLESSSSQCNVFRSKEEPKLV